MKIFIDRWETFWKYKDLLKQLVLRDIKLKYRRSFLGYVWSILNPLLTMVVMVVVFSTMFRRNIENFPVYLFTGQILFDFMSQSTRKAMGSITSNASLLKKTYVPKYIFTVANITSGLVDLIFSLAALIIVMLVTGARFHWTNLLFPFVLIQLYLFCLGLGLFLGAANVFFRDIQYIYNAVLKAWGYLTPIFYPIDALPENIQWIIKHLNPMYFYVGQFRDIVYSGQVPGPIIITAGCITSIIMLMIGVVVFLKSQNKLILYI